MSSIEAPSIYHLRRSSEEQWRHRKWSRAHARPEMT